MKKDLRMVAKSPDPDDLADEMLPDPEPGDRDELNGHKAKRDHSAPHIPPLESGKISSDE